MKPLCLALMIATSPAFADPAITLMPSADLSWDVTPEGVAFAPLSGDRWQEPYFAMVRLPAGTASPLHIKSADMFGVLIEGQMTHTRSGAQPPEVIGPGSYYHIPAHLPHISACVSATPCTTMLYQNGAFGFVPVQP